MSRTIEFLPDLGIIHVKTTGTYVLGKELETLKKVLSAMNAHNCQKCLFDHRDATVVAETMSAFHRSEHYQEIGFQHSMQLATLVNEISKDLLFYENATSAHNWKTKVFDDYDAAIAWLTS